MQSAPSIISKIRNQLKVKNSFPQTDEGRRLFFPSLLSGSLVCATQMERLNRDLCVGGKRTRRDGQ